MVDSWESQEEPKATTDYTDQNWFDKNNSI